MKRLPTLVIEKTIVPVDFIPVGVDEVGRGAWAGPVVAGAVSIKFNNRIQWEKIGINDSKKLSPQKREKLAVIIRNNARWAIGEVGVSFINRYGIVKATEKAMRQAIKDLRNKIEDRRKNNQPCFMLVDAFHVKYVPGVGLKNQKAIVKGDEKSISIAAASIIAKVHRDKLMTEIGEREKRYKVYKWGTNKGYGTKAHQEAIKKYGVTRLHRKLYLRKLGLKSETFMV